MISTYSFEDTSFIISHPDVGTYSVYGSGMGDVTVKRENNVTTHNVAADLSVLITRSAKKNGTIELNILQSSEANDFLNKLCKYLETCPPERFALASVSIINRTTGENWDCKNVTHQKMPDRAYKSEGDFVQYTLMSADISLQ